MLKRPIMAKIAKNERTPIWAIQNANENLVAQIDLRIEAYRPMALVMTVREPRTRRVVLTNRSSSSEPSPDWPKAIEIVKMKQRERRVTGGRVG